VINADGPGKAGPPAAIADYLGLTQDELRAQLESGKTLAQIASAQGKPVSGLEDAKTHLDQAVADGKLTSDQEQTMLAELKSHLDDVVNGTGPKSAVRGAGGGPFGEAAAAYLGLTPAELRAQIESGKTLAQIATDQGKPVDGLEAAILAGAKTALDKAVTAGKITAAQEQQMLDDLKSHIDDVVNGAGPVRRTVSA
jgi:polyhydroxyalkanoate synthesis regulator phasin